MIMQAARFAVGLFSGGGRAGRLARIKEARAARIGGSTAESRRLNRQSVQHAARSAPDRRDALDQLWKLDSATALFERIHSQLSSWTSTFIHTVQVGAVGGPNADLRRVWYLACAAAFGRFRNRIGGTGLLEYQLEATWDVTNKSCLVTLGYTVKGLLHQAQSALTPDEGSFAGRLFNNAGLRTAWGALEGGGAIAPPGSAASRTVLGGIDGARELIQRGPDQLTVGGGWPLFLKTESADARDAVQFQPLDGLQGKAQLTQNGEYLIRRFGGPGGPADPNVFRERPWPTMLNGVSVMALPYGQVADLGALPTFFRLYGPAKQPFTLIGITKTETGTVALQPVLPDAGRVITTGEKYHPDVQSPRPSADGFSRLTPLQLVTLALEAPCRAPETVAPTNTPIGHKGVRVQDARTASQESLNRPIVTSVEAGAAVSVAAAVGGLIARTTGAGAFITETPVNTVDNAVPRVTEEATE